MRAEYCHHDAALEGNVHSNKPDLIERQFEKFMQANTILKSRDLGSIMCDIKFSELTYLDAFWRDYINGSLLEALKGVFITGNSTGYLPLLLCYLFVVVCKTIPQVIYLHFFVIYLLLFVKPFYRLSTSTSLLFICCCL